MSHSQKNTNSDSTEHIEKIFGASEIPEFNADIDHEYLENMINIYVEGNDMFFTTLTGIDKIINYIEFAYKLVIPPPMRHRGLDTLFYLFDKLVENETRARSGPKHIILKPPKNTPSKDSSTTPQPKKAPRSPPWTPTA